MDKNLLKRLIALVLTGGVLLSSTGVYTALAAEEITTSEYTSALVESTDAATNETTVPSTTESTTSETTVDETTEKLTETTTQAVKKPETTTSSPIVEEEVTQKPEDNKAVEWVGVNGSVDSGSESNPYAVSSAEHLLAMNEYINNVGSSNKYFRLTADIDFSNITLDSDALKAQADTGMEYSVVSVDPSLSSANVFFALDGDGHKITNVEMEANDLASISFFGFLNSASSIENVIFENVEITNSYSAAMAAGIILKNEGTVKDCRFTNVEIDTSSSSTTADSFYPTSDSSIRVYTGTAIVVDNSGVFDCETNYNLGASIAQVSVVRITTGRPYAGVLVAQNRGKVNKIRVQNMTVTGHSTRSNCVGGLVGANLTTRTSSTTGVYYAELLNHPDNGGVTGADKIGLLVGDNTGRVQRSTVYGKFKTNKNATATSYDLKVYGGKTSGGIVGSNTGDVQICSAIDVGVYFADTTEGTVYGGIVGTTTYGIRNCVATGSTAGAGTGADITRYVGGIVGVGDTSSSFSVENCYALVKIIDSKAVLGSIVGFNGDTAYNANRIRNVYYSSIISTRPSPVSYGAAGEGDLVFSKPYENAFLGKSVKANKSEFTVSGWAGVTFETVGNFTCENDPAKSVFTPGASSMTYRLTSNGNFDKTSVYYDVNITLPAGIGIGDGSIILSNEPMEFGILNTYGNLVGDETKGNPGTKDNPFVINVDGEIGLFSVAPAAHFVVSSSASFANIDDSILANGSATFWGSIDFNNVKLPYNSKKPLFKGIYGSRNDSLSNNDSTNHISNVAEDAASNLTHGVISNANIVISSSAMSNFFGDICNATVKKSTITFASTVTSVNASESNSGLFARTVYGNSYLYGCYVDAPTVQYRTTSSYNAVSAFIGTVNAQKALIDNCGANMVVYVEYSGASNCAVFIGEVKSLSGGYIQNCYASGGVTLSGGSLSSNNYIFVGKTASSSTQIHNCYYSPSDYYSTGKGVNDGIRTGSYTGTCKVWSFGQQSGGKWVDVSIKVVTAGSDTVHLANLTNIDRFDYSTYESLPVGGLNSYFSYESASTSLNVNNMLWTDRVTVIYTFNGAANTNATLKVTHHATGLVARLTVYNSSDMDLVDGYFLIKTPIDLYYLSEHQTDLALNSTERKYTGPNAKIRLAADIDMTGYTIEPIDNFMGEFVSDNYTISNLSFTTGGVNQALFSSVNGATISGVNIDNADIIGSTYCAALVGRVIDSVTIENCKVTNSNINGTKYVGAIVGGIQTKDDSAGTLSTTISGCTVENSKVVSTTGEGTFAYVGGIIGSVGEKTDDKGEIRSAAIENCSVSKSEISSNGYGIGGIVGFAPNAKNTINNCTVTASDIYSNGESSTTSAALGGIAGIFGGLSISKCTVVDSNITGDCAAGIVTRLVNPSSASTISECTVTNTKITSDDIASGVLSQISGGYYGDKLIDNCKISADTTVKALVAGGIVGNVQTFSDKVLTISNCTNLGTIETTGNKGSVIDGAGGIVGRFASALSTSGITITNCLSQGTVKGSSIIGGIIGVQSSLAHSGASKLISNCYVTSEFESGNLSVVNGLIVGYVGGGNANNISAISENVYYSSLDTKVPLFGNVSATAQSAGAYDMNLGADQNSGLIVNSGGSSYNAHFVKIGTNTVEIKTNVNETRVVIDNEPSLDGFSAPSRGTFSCDASTSKLSLGSAASNRFSRLEITTFDKKCNTTVYTIYDGTVNGETVEFKVGFTVIVRGIHVFDGDGTKENPYKIYEAEDLIAIKQHHDSPNDGSPIEGTETNRPNFGEVGSKFYAADTYYEVMNDIDMSAELKSQDLSFAPIGSENEPFMAHISSTEGNEYTISNMYINTPVDAKSYAGNEDFKADGYSDALGVFGYTNGAEISNLRFKNVQIVSSASAANNYLGVKTGSVVGQAINTTILNVEVAGVNIKIGGTTGTYGSAVGGIVGQAKDAVVLSDVSVVGTDSENVGQISSLYMTGGIVGSAADSVGGSITNAKVENVNITNEATSGTGIAGAVAGQYTGTITGTYIEQTITEEVEVDGVIEEVTKTVVTRTPVVINNVNVTAIVAGGVVGSGNINNLGVSGDTDLTIKYVDVTNTTVNVASAVMENSTSVANGVAGGILGTTNESYDYLIEDCTLDSNSSVNSGYCAGGIVGRVKSRGRGSLQSDASMFIKNCSTYAEVNQLHAPTTDTLNITDKNIIGAGSIIGLISTTALVMKSDNSPQVQVSDCTAGGKISGTFNVGGIIGAFSCVQIDLNKAKESIVKNCVVTATLSALKNATDRFGVIVGSIEGNTKTATNEPNSASPFPELGEGGYAVNPFDKIFYSSYTTSNYKLYGLSEIQNYQDPTYSVFTGTIYDVNQVNYNYKPTANDDPIKLPISLAIDGMESGDPTDCYQWFGESDYEFSDDFIKLLKSNEGSGTPFGFTLAGVDFTLAEVNGISSSDEGIFKVGANENANANHERYPYEIKVQSYGTADLIFTYNNGLQVAIPVICGVEFSGEGDEDSPILVENEEIFFYLTMMAMPGASYKQIAPLDFTEKRNLVATVATLADNFTGTYDGNGQSITGLSINIDSSETPIGIFGNITGQKKDADGNVIPNVKDLTFINCTVNSGDTDAGTGVFAGSVTNGATVQNITVENSSVTSETGPVGGAIGTISGTSVADKVTVTGTKVTTGAGSAGGIAGTMTDEAATISSPKVENTVITSGTVNGDNFAGGVSEDIAGGIVAQAIGTISGSVTEDENGNTVLENAVSGSTIRAFISGGAVGAIYDAAGVENGYSFNLNNVKVSATNVVAATADTTRINTSAAGLLGVIRGKTNLTFNNNYVDSACEVTSHRYAGGVIGTNTTSDFTSLNIINTETYASVTAAQPVSNQDVYAGGIIGYITATQTAPLDLNIITMDGCVAGGTISAEGQKTYAGGVIGGFNTEYITEQINSAFFTNGIISATVNCSVGNNQGSGTVVAPTERYGKFIAGYDETDTETPIFSEEHFATAFNGNYYSTHPQNIQFFGSSDGKTSLIDSYQSLNENAFKDINVSGNLVVADENRDSWNSVAITKDIGSTTQLYTKLALYENIEYGSKNAERKLSTADEGGFTLVETDGNDCITFDPSSITSVGNGVYGFTVTPSAYGAEYLVAEYTCGLATTATILSVEIKGEGTKEKPYLIGTPTQLRVVGYLAGNNNYFRQINDIKLEGSYNPTGGMDTDLFINYNGGKGFAPIGTENTPFSGVYDGQGYKITGMYINRDGESNVGLFGVVRPKDSGLVPTIKNVHLELIPATVSGTETKANGIIGENNVGGIAGSAISSHIINCSVTLGSVTGNDSVGGIVGYFDNSQVTNSFTQSDVNAFGEDAKAGGIVGVVEEGLSNGSKISGCFASGSIYATPFEETMSDEAYAGGIVGHVDSTTGLVIENCLFTGTTASGHGILGSGGAAANMAYTISSCIDAGQNIAMAAGDRFDKISKPVSSAEAYVTYKNVYYDSSLLKVGSALKDGITGMPTSDLIKPQQEKEKAGISDEYWTFNEGYYPVPKVSSIEVTTYDESYNATTAEPVNDPYSLAYARFLSAPVQISEGEECDDINDTSDYGYGKGLVYPVTLLTKVYDSDVTYSSSVFDTSDTVDYPTGYDTHLYGIGANKNVDLLFEDKDTGYTSVYRNIFDTTKNLVQRTESITISKNTRVHIGAASGAVFSNGEAYYNTQVPVVYATAEIDGVTVQREIKLPLSHGTTYCVATQRQLYALGRADYELVENTKFSGYYSSKYNYKLITDIDCGNNETLFTPIGSDTTAGYTGQFDGSNHTIKNLKIKSNGNYVGMFSKISQGGTNVDPFIKNLTLENATVEGADYVGALVGQVYLTNVTIENCHAIGSVERDEDSNITATYGTVTGKGSYVGGLIGKVDYPSDIISKSSSSVTVYGNKDSVGGLIGESSGTITSCYATGNVICERLTNTDISGVGGLVGIMRTKSDKVDNEVVYTTIEESFASGNVEVKTFNHLTSAKYGVGGLVGFVTDLENVVVEDAITECFSGGNVSVGTSDILPTTGVTGKNTGIVGVGGLSGINYEAIESCYSSAAVSAEFGRLSNYSNDATLGIGVGGVCGVALADVSNIYSSGSVAPSYDLDETTTGTVYFGIGGTIGTTMDSDADCQYCYFDKWTNTVTDLKSIGDSEGDTTSAKSLTTPQLTNGAKPDEGTWDDEVWGFTTSAYPYLKSLLNENVDDYIKTNAILSVVCVELDEDDVSAKSGKGITMALTIPTTFSYKAIVDGEETDVEYTLIWEGATVDKEHNLAAINRTKNVAEYLEVTAMVKDYEHCAARVYRRLCADMKGTYEQPYLIGNETDLAHVNMSTEKFEEAVVSHPDFYGQWATPLDEGNNQVAGTVYYQLMSNVEVTNTSKIPEAPESYTYTVTIPIVDEEGNPVTDPNTGEIVTKKVEETFEYEGFVFNGNAYAIRNASTSGTYIANLNDKSKITNMIFENLTFANGSGSALVGTNNGEIYDVYVKSTVGDGTAAVENAAGLVLTNNGLIDGCVVDITLKGAAKDVAVMALTNNGTIKNSGTAGTVDTMNSGNLSNIGAFVSNNTGSIESSFSMADINVLTKAGEAVENLSGFAAVNSGTIDGVYTRSAISFENAPAATQTVASLVGALDGGSVTNSYAAGLLGYYNDSQESIAFGTVYADFVKPDSVYVDKSLAGQASYNSFRYTASTSSIMNLKYMADGMIYGESTPNGKFIAGDAESLTFPQLATILNVENTAVSDENGDPIVFENGTIIRNYDVIKAYSKLSSVALKTAQSQYADRLAANSDVEGLNSSLSTVDGITFVQKSGQTTVVSVYPGRITTTNNANGKETLVASYRNPVELTRGMTISPQLLIDIAVVNDVESINPNFSSGRGTADNPYIISDANGLQSLTYYGSDDTLYFALGKDIDMSDYAFEQIPVFAAHLNENVTSQYAIENLKSTDGGMFGLADNAVINNVALAGADVTSSDVYTGALADKVNGGTITNCVVSADVTSTSADTSASTGALAGIVYGTSDISGIITTGNVNADAGAAGGIIGYAENVTMHELVSTANVCNIEQAGGIVGVMGEEATLENALFGGVAKNNKPIVSTVADVSKVTKVYYDNQLNKDVAADAIGEGKATSKCSTVFAENDKFATLGNKYYPVPAGVATALDNSDFASYGSTAALAAATMTFYVGSSRGYIGYYTSMQFVNQVTVGSVEYDITVTEEGSEGYFDITNGDSEYSVRVHRFNPSKDPAVIMTLENGAKRTICPGLVRTANVTYTVTNSTGDDLTGKTLGVLIKSVVSKTNLDTVNVLNDFTSGMANGVTGEEQKVDNLIISEGVDGFYVGEMLPEGYEYEVSATLNGVALSSDKITVEENVYGTFVNLGVDDQSEVCEVELELKIVKVEDTPWGVRSRNNTIW